MEQHHPIVPLSVKYNRRRGRDAHEKGKLPHLIDGDSVHMKEEDVCTCGKLWLRCRDLRRVVNTWNGFYQVEDLRNYSITNIHGSLRHIFWWSATHSSRRFSLTHNPKHHASSIISVPFDRLLETETRRQIVYKLSIRFHHNFVFSALTTIYSL